MKKITYAYSKNGRRMWYVDGKRVSFAKAVAVGDANICELISRLLASSKYGAQIVPNGTFELTLWIKPAGLVSFCQSEHIKTEHYFKTARGAMKALNWLVSVMPEELLHGLVTRRLFDEDGVIDCYEMLKRQGAWLKYRKGLLGD